MDSQKVIETLFGEGDNLARLFARTNPAEDQRIGAVVKMTTSLFKLAEKDSENYPLTSKTPVNHQRRPSWNRLSSTFPSTSSTWTVWAED